MEQQRTLEMAVALSCVALRCWSAGEQASPACRFAGSFFAVSGPFRFTSRFSLARVGLVPGRKRRTGNKASCFFFICIFFLSYFILVLANIFNNELLLSRQEGVDQLSANSFGSFGARHAYIHISLPTEYY